MLFLLIANNPAELEVSIADAFPGRHVNVGPGQWLLSTEDSPTPQNVWERVVGTAMPTGLVVPFVGYFGRQSRDVWEWIDRG